MSHWESRALRAARVARPGKPGLYAQSATGSVGTRTYEGRCLADSNSLRAARMRYSGFPNAMKPPFVTRGDALSGSTFWHGKLMDEWANSWVNISRGARGIS